MSNLGDTAPVKEGEILAGKYRVDKLLGVGGMGVVVAATHVHIGKKVALKFMLPQALTIPVAVERFLREARAAVQLRGEHVAQVLDVGSLDNGSPYMVMEFLEGNDLGNVVQGNGRLPIPDAVDFVMQACEAVAEAHSAGIVHRDIKPRNLFLTRRVDHTPLVKVLDFGISKIVPRDGQEDHSLTRTSDVMGSPNYMSPEQIKSTRQVDGRTDIWALGVVLYELLSGQVPFPADTMPQLCGLVLQEPPAPLLDIRPEVPPGLWAVIVKCLEKDPAARFQSCAELVAALEPFAPPRSRIVGERVRAMTSTHPLSAAASSVAPPLPSAAAALSEKPSATSSSWADTRSPEPSRSKAAPILIAVAAALAGAVGVGAWIKKSSAPAASAAAAPSSTVVAPPSVPIATAPVAPASSAPPAATHEAPSSSPSAVVATAPKPTDNARTPRTGAPHAAAPAASTPRALASAAAPSSSAPPPRTDSLMPLDRK